MKTRTVNGVKVAYLERGTGPAVLLVHGFPLDHTMWSAQLEALCDRHRVIVPDLRGFGRSGVTPGTVTMEQFADDLAALLDGLGIGEPVALGGLSMGGYVAFQFVRKHARRLAALMLCDTRAVADTPEQVENRRQTADRLERDGTSWLPETMIPRLFAKSTVESRPEIVAAMREVMAAGDPRGLAAASRGMALRPNATTLLERIACPTLVLVGAEDALSPAAEMRRIASAIEKSRCVEIPAAGHMAPVEQPQAVNAALGAFLGEVFAA